MIELVTDMKLMKRTVNQLIHYYQKLSQSVEDIKTLLSNQEISQPEHQDVSIRKSEILPSVN